MPFRTLPLAALTAATLAGAASAEIRLRGDVLERIPNDLRVVDYACVDLSLTLATRIEGGSVRVISTVTNVSDGPYRGGPGQQRVVLAVNAQPLHRFDFEQLRAGQSQSFDVVLPIDSRVNRFTGSLSYDPVTALDRTDRNDDCNRANDQASARLF